MDQCKRCGVELNEGSEQVEFYDEFSEEELKITIEAIWCSSCGYFKIGAE